MWRHPRQFSGKGVDPASGVLLFEKSGDVSLTSGEEVIPSATAWKVSPTSRTFKDKGQEVSFQLDFPEEVLTFVGFIPAGTTDEMQGEIFDQSKPAKLVGTFGASYSGAE